MNPPVRIAPGLCFAQGEAKRVISATVAAASTLLRFPEDHAHNAALWLMLALTAAAYLFPRFPPLEVFRRRPQSMSRPRHRGRHSKTCTGTDMASTIFSSPAACDLADAVDEQLRHRARRREHVCGSISCFCIRDIKETVDRKRRMEPAGTWRAVPLESDRAKPKMRRSICFAYTLLPYVQWKSVAHTRLLSSLNLRRVAGFNTWRSFP